MKRKASAKEVPELRSFLDYYTEVQTEQSLPIANSYAGFLDNAFLFCFHAVIKKLLAQSKSAGS